MSLRLRRALRQTVVGMAACAALAACGGAPDSNNGGNTSASCSKRVSPTYSGPSERSYCSTVTDYTGQDPVDISVAATYQKWTTTSGGLDGFTEPAIRYAEVEVLDSAGNRIQCGALSSTGTATLSVPASTDPYTVRINARVNDSTVAKASVMDCPEENNIYSITSTVTADDSSNPPGQLNMMASAGKVVGAADGTVASAPFNILDRIVDANQFLENEVNNCSSTYTGCTDVNSSAIPPKVSIYWEQGFNPNEYYGSPTSGVSYYMPTYRRLFILGGIDGDVDNEDTDQFDDSVIIHEYGHFLEDVYSITDSPGGSHSGNGLVDPRLAWSEGWGNFFQAAVRNEATYRDSYGNKDTINHYGLFFDIPLDSPASGCTTNPDASGCDVPEYEYEGNFREFSVTRYLWDLFDNSKFEQLWATMTSTEGMRNPDQEFRNVGLLNEIHDTDLEPTDKWTTYETDDDNETGDTLEYARYLEADGTCSADGPVANPDLNFSMTPWSDPGGDDNGSFATSHLLLDNDFYFVKLTPSATVSVRLTYKTDTDGTVPPVPSVPSDLDLYVYNSSARFGYGADVVAYSQDPFSSNASATEIETTSSKTLSAGNYLINVKNYTGKYNGKILPTGDPLHYKLEVRLNSGSWIQLCPATRP